MWQRRLSVIHDLERHRSGAGRVRVVGGITLAAFIVVVAQLWHLQVLEGPHLSELSDRNRIRVRFLPAPRGTLYDRHGVALVEAHHSCCRSFPASSRIEARSSPAFDLTRFTGSMDRDKWLRLVRDPAHPLLNRAFQSQYPPGSIFKLSVAAAALEEGVITPSERLPCPSSIKIGGRDYRNWKDENLGLMDLRRAIATSCDTFFYQLGARAGIERIARYAEAFGLGRPTGVAIPGEKSGSIPGLAPGRDCWGATGGPGMLPTPPSGRARSRSRRCRSHFS